MKTSKSVPILVLCFVATALFCACHNDNIVATEDGSEELLADAAMSAVAPAPAKIVLNEDADYDVPQQYDEVPPVPVASEVPLMVEEPWSPLDGFLPFADKVAPWKAYQSFDVLPTRVNDDEERMYSFELDPRTSDLLNPDDDDHNDDDDRHHH